MPDHAAVNEEVRELFHVSETSPTFQDIFNQEIIGGFKGLGKRSVNECTPRPPQSNKKPKGKCRTYTTNPSRFLPSLQLDQGTSMLQRVDL